MVYVTCRSSFVLHGFHFPQADRQSFYKTTSGESNDLLIRYSDTPPPKWFPFLKKKCHLRLLKKYGRLSFFWGGKRSQTSTFQFAAFGGYPLCIYSPHGIGGLPPRNQALEAAKQGLVAATFEAWRRFVSNDSKRVWLVGFQDGDGMVGWFSR